ncbi:RHE_PE00001 family protein [Microvirga thermotolerans]|uniref:RHE_PE00001 family protein n=1 Tax=Microvirga thermotolerans TaxID=2651334 RepID=UPI001FE7FD86|nr:RHE_PE00001 family protein [Microvirga thermotolerans]
MFESRGRYDDEDFAPLVPKTYDLPDLPWSLAGKLERTSIAVTHLDARLAASGLAAGWQSRCDMVEATRALILDGHFVDIGDVVLHDAGMDVRSPTHELTRAAAALRARRMALARKAPWPLSIDGLSALRGLTLPSGLAKPLGKGMGAQADYEPDHDDEDPLAGHFAEIDAILARTSKTLAGETPLPKRRSHLVYDPEIDEAENEDLWLDVVKRTEQWPAIAAAAITWDAWTALGMYPRQPWLGLIMAGSILRARGLTTHLLPLVSGYKASRYRLQGGEGGVEKVEAFARIVDEAVSQGEKDLQRLILARETMMRRAKDCRSNSRLPQLIDLFLSRPLVSVAIASKLIGVTPKAVDLMLAQLGGALPRELTGRRRYRAWGIV